MVPAKPKYRFLFLAAFLLSFYYALALYINSSFLGTYFSEQGVNLLYMSGSLIALFGLIVSSRVLKRFGNYPMVLLGLLGEAAAIFTLATATSPLVIAIAFIAHQAIPPLLLFGLDIFFEGSLAATADAEKTRSYYLMFLNFAYVLAPLIIAALVRNNSFSIVYLISSSIVLVLLALVAYIFKGVNPKRYREVGFIDSLRKFLKRKHLSKIFLVNFMLQCFYAIMTIFTAPYLHNTMGLSWEHIGIVFTIMLIPFVLFNAPLAKLFDKYHDEKDIIVAGFIFMILALVVISFITTSNFIVWAAILFISRIGASFVETGSEAAFYRQMTDQDAGFIGIFHMTVPLSYVIAPTVASLFLPYLAVPSLFLLLAAILIIGIIGAYKIQ